MILGILSRMARVRITLSYAAALVAVSTALVVLGPRVQHQVILHVSTNLHNLARGKIGTLFGSAFVIDAAPMYIWLPGLVCLLALAELHWRSGRLTVAFLLGHVGATLVVAAGLVAAIEFGWLPLSISRASDVGVSYGAVAVLGALTTAIPRRWRPAWMGWRSRWRALRWAPNSPMPGTPSRCSSGWRWPLASAGPPTGPGCGMRCWRWALHSASCCWRTPR